MKKASKKPGKWIEEVTNPHFILVAVAGLFLVCIGLYLFFTGNVSKAVYGLVLWSYGIMCLGFSVGFNFGKYGK